MSTKPTKPTNQPKQMRGFRCMSFEARTAIAAMGGRKTARKHGKKHMSAIGKNGRRKRTLRERRERKAAAVNAALQDQDA